MPLARDRLLALLADDVAAGAVVGAVLERAGLTSAAARSEVTALSVGEPATSGTLELDVRWSWRVYALGAASSALAYYAPLPVSHPARNNAKQRMWRWLCSSNSIAIPRG